MDLHNQEIEIELWYECGEPALLSVRTGNVVKTEYFGEVTHHNQGDFENGKFSLLSAKLRRLAQ